MFTVAQPEPSSPPVQGYGPGSYEEAASQPAKPKAGPLPMQPGWFPRWLTGEVAPPKIYMQVQEAATA